MVSKVYEMAHIVFEEFGENVFRLTKDRCNSLSESYEILPIEGVRKVYKSYNNVLVIRLNGKEFNNFGETYNNLTDEMVDENERYLNKLVYKNATIILNKQMDDELLNLHYAVKYDDSNSICTIKDKLTSLKNTLMEVESVLKSI